MKQSIERYMIVSVTIVFFFCNMTSIFCQLKTPKSYTLVTGISKYEDPNITSLNFAHLDALAYAQFCMSPEGLNIPEDQIMLLTNEKAT